MSDVFISYSRLDVDFVRQLRDALAKEGQEVWIDWESIPESVGWWEEIKKGIARANNFAVILSPNSMASPICQMEIEYAIELNKRIIPVYHADFDRKHALMGIAERLADDEQAVTREIWENRQAHTLFDDNDTLLKRINYFFFKANDDFDQRFADLLEVIQTDYVHKEQHTTLTLRASEWQRRNKDSGFLLIGSELQQAQDWLASADGKEPIPTQLHRDYIQASEKRNRQLQAVRYTAVIGSIVAVLAIVVSIFAGQNAITSTSQAETAQVQANYNLITATVAQGLAIVEADNAQTSEALAIEAETQVAIQGTARQDAIQQANVAATQVFVSGEQIKDIETQQALAEVALEEIQLESYSYQMAGQSQLNILNENDSLAFAFESVSMHQSPLSDIQPIFYSITNQSRNRKSISQDTAIVSGSLHPDGSIYAVGNANGSITLWDLPTGNHLTTLQGHEFAIEDITFNPSGRVIASASAEGTIKLWNSQSYEMIAILPHGDWVSRVAFSPDGNLLASTSHDVATIWDADSHQALFRIRLAARPTALAFHPNGKHLAIASCGDFQIICRQGNIDIWDITSGTQIQTISTHDADINSLAYSPDGQTLGTASTDDTIQLWHTDTYEIQATLTGHTSIVTDIAFSPDGKTLASSSYDQTVKLWDLNTMSLLHSLSGHINRVYTVAFHPNSNLLISASRDDTVKMWDVGSINPFMSFAGHEYSILYISFSPDDAVLASSSYDQTIKLWDSQTGSLINTLTGHSDSVFSVVFNQDGKKLISASGDQTIKLWDTQTGSLINTLSGHSDVVYEIALNPDNTILASVSYDDTIKLWDMNTSELIQTLTTHTDDVRGIAFSPDGRILASASDDETIRLWEVDSGDLLRTLRGHELNVRSVTFSPDGTILASASDDETIRLWEVSSGKLLHILIDHKLGIFDITFSPDGLMLASAGSDEIIRLWNVDDGILLATLSGHSDWITHIEFNHTGTMLASSSLDGTIMHWNMSSLPLMRQWVQENRFIREFTCGERDRFNMLMQCDENGQFPTRTLYPTPSPIPLPSWTPFWTPLPTATATPLPDPVPLTFLTETAEADD